ncbi:MAG: toast rack family protein [Chloroflexota bacterium]
MKKDFFNKPGTIIKLAMITLVLSTLACGFQTNIPSASTPSPDVTDEISIPVPDADINLSLSFGAGKLSLAPGSKNLVDGSATYNIPEFKPEIKSVGGDISISQTYQVNSFPTLKNMKNEWDLKLGTAPMNLTINAGAYEGHFDFGGLALTNLNINDGAAEVTADFSAPNPNKLNVLSYKTGASNVTLQNLGNANFASLIFESGAGNYKLDFGGTLQRDSSVNIRSGMSNLTLIIPANVAATVKVSSGLSNVQFPSSWKQNGDTYSQSGTGPALTIVIEMGAGNVQISE